MPDNYSVIPWLQNVHRSLNVPHIRTAAELPRVPCSLFRSSVCIQQKQNHGIRCWEILSHFSVVVNTRCTWKPAFIPARISEARGHHSTQRTQVYFELKMNWAAVCFTFKRSAVLKQTAKFRRPPQPSSILLTHEAHIQHVCANPQVSHSWMFVLITALP